MHGIHASSRAARLTCGEAEGMVMAPPEFDLTDSTFAAVSLDDGCDAQPFPPPIYKCSML